MKNNNNLCIANRILLGSVFLALIIFAILYFIEHNKNIDSKINLKKIEIKKINKKIDLIRSDNISISNYTLKANKESAEYSKKITKKLSNEKISIPDTTYAAMCKYITSYK